VLRRASAQGEVLRKAKGHPYDSGALKGHAVPSRLIVRPGRWQVNPAAWRPGAGGWPHSLIQPAGAGCCA
jgi:hypothetical protein